jgi:hypothetical protein
VPWNGKTIYIFELIRDNMVLGRKERLKGERGSRCGGLIGFWVKWV